jgi:hypothetical protein
MIKSEVVEKKQEIEFPCLMRSEFTGKIVLMTKKNGNSGVGMVIVASDETYKVGHHSSCWVFKDFKPLQEKVILENIINTDEDDTTDYL